MWKRTATKQVGKTQIEYLQLPASAMSEHGNSKQNNKLQHLYGIYEWGTNALFKYGISAGKIGADGMSKRMRLQVTFLNLGAGFNKFFAKILLVGIPAGRLPNASSRNTSAITVNNMGRTRQGISVEHYVVQHLPALLAGWHTADCGDVVGRGGGIKGLQGCWFQFLALVFRSTFRRNFIQF